MRKPKWPPEVKARAVAICGEKGAQVASVETGVPASTIRVWVNRSVASASAAMVPVEQRSAEVTIVERPAPWPQRRAAVVQNLTDGLDEAVEQARLATRAGKLRDARDGWISVGILVDKVSLLVGDVTSRIEQRVTDGADHAEIKAKIAELERELGYR